MSNNIKDLYLIDDGYAKPRPYFANSFESAMKMFIQDNYDEEYYCNCGEMFKDEPIKITNSNGDEKSFTCNIKRIYEYSISEVK